MELGRVSQFRILMCILHFFNFLANLLLISSSVVGMNHDAPGLYDSLTSLA